MAGIQPGDRRTTPTDPPTRRLDRAPGERYAQAGTAERGTAPTADEAPTRRRALFVPLARAAIVATVGALVLYALGALLSSSAGLVFVAGLTGAAVGLLLARAAAPGAGEEPGLTRRQVTWSALALTVAAVAIGAVGTWLHAIAEGGALGLVDYLLETFGILVPAELVIGAVAAAWGAGAGPVER
jgi:hypothetical protein